MDVSSSPSYFSNIEPLDTFTKSQEDRLFAKYMRLSPSPDPNKAQSAITCSSEETPSPLDELGCYNDCDDLNEDDEIDDDDPPAQVPLSSSPPDFTSSSPQSCSLGSQDSETCSMLAHISSDLDSEAHVLGLQQLNVSKVELAETSGTDDFPQKLHCLLLAGLEERRRLKASSSQSDAETQDGILSDRTNSAVSASSDVDKSDADEPHADYDGRSMSTSTGNENRSPTRIQNYRIIKRARSKSSYDTAEDFVEGPSKRQKIRKDDVSHAKPRVYARRTASLRQAESLKIDYVNNPKVGLPQKIPRDILSNEWKANNYVETVPATPALETPDHRHRARGNRISKKEQGRRVIETPVPIIAPPPGHSAGLPLNAEQLAKQRLFSLLEREQDGRERDGLYLKIGRGPRSDSFSNTGCDAPACLESNRTSLTSEWEATLGLGRQDREEAVEWLLEVIPKGLSRASSHSTSVSTSTRGTSSSGTSQGTPSCCSTPSISTPSSSLSDLEDQLTHSPNTRFHAVWLLLRYFRLCMRVEGSKQSENLGLSRTSSIDSARSNATDSEGLNLILWDVTVACLSVSIKFHRDFLDPLLPVFAHEYLALAPHEMSYEDLETAHRDILSAIGYRLGVTPQPIMDELWLALPSLRLLLQFDGGWEHATSHTWAILFIALDEPDILRFPVSMLTIVALMEGVVQSLAAYNHGRQMKKTGRHHDGQDPHLNNLALERRFRKKARQESEGVLCDIQALTGITDAELRECCTWIRNLD